MKKMQCEVCGSTEIKKVSDGIFECQSCGVQYNTTEVKKLLVEVTGKVKIDHSEEVENNIKRAEQYAEAGNDTKAAEYYNAALDMDADNKIAQKRVKEIADQQELGDYYVIEPDVDPQENVKHFFEQLATTENMACDIYKEIAIKSVTEKYMTFYFMKAKYQVDWTATACHIYYENQTVYKERYDSTLKRRVKEPVTEKVQRVNRVPQSGTHIFNSEELVLASDSLGKHFAVETDTAKRALLSAFETQQDSKYGTYNTQRINPRDVQKENGRYIYKGLVLDAQIDKRIYSDRKTKMADSASERVAPEITNSIGGDYYENLNAIRHTLSESVAYVCIPVQIIEYTYKGKNYAALSDLLSYTTTMPLIYPCDTELAEAKETMNKEKNSSVKLPFVFWLGIVGFCVGVCLLLMATISSDGDAYGFGAIGIWVVSTILMIAGAAIRSARINTFRKKAQEAKRQLHNPRVIAITNSFKAFMSEYQNYAMLSNANKAASADSISIEKTHIAVTSHRQIQEIADEEAVVSEQEKEIIRLEEEIELLKKKRILPIILMTVFGILIIPLFVGAILIGNVNAKINQKNAELNKIKTDWINK